MGVLIKKIIAVFSATDKIILFIRKKLDQFKVHKIRARVNLIKFYAENFKARKVRLAGWLFSKVITKSFYFMYNNIDFAIRSNRFFFKLSI